MANPSLPSVEVLRKLLSYNPETGDLTWRERDMSWFKDGVHSAENVCKRWNSQFAGKTAFTSDDGRNYMQGMILNRPHKAHRVAYAIHHGEWPADQIDHINGVRDDNRIANLREVTNQENCRNAKMPITNTSGVMGVYWQKRAQKWQSAIKVGGKNKHLGLFSKKADAIQARKEAEKEYGYHPNHGRSVSKVS